MDYLKLTNCYCALERTSKRLEKTAIVAEFLSTLRHERDVKHIVYLLQGHVFPPWDERKIGVSEKLIIKVLASSLGFPKEKVEKLFVKCGDLGIVAEELMKSKKQMTLAQRSVTTEVIVGNLQKLASLEGEGTVARKLNLVAELLTSATPVEARFIVRTVLEDLRIGLGDGTVRDAIVWAFFGKELSIEYTAKENEFIIPETKKGRYAQIVDAVQHAYDMTNDFAEVVEKVVQHGEKGLHAVTLGPGKPVNMMLAVKVESAAEAAEALGLPVLCDFKLDGFRMQMHKNGEKVVLFTRRLENVTRQFQELIAIVRKEVHAKSCILDAEIVGCDPKTGKYVPFQDISQRIHRKYDIEALAKKIPVEINVFDVLYVDGEDVTSRPQSERRALVEKIIHPVKGKIAPTTGITAQSVAEIQKFYEKALQAGLEGVMVKSLAKEYTSGRKVGGWVKLKPVLENLDLVIVKAEYGSGKRTGVLSSFTVACRANETFVEIGKVSTGVKEKEEEGVSYTEITKSLKPLIVDQHGKEVTVKPKIVIEVSYEEIQKSPSYSSGYALRFPRFVRLRTVERRAEECNTLEDVERIYKSQHTRKGKFHSKVQA